MEGQQKKGDLIQDEINLIVFLRLVWQYKLLILITTFVCFFLGITYIYYRNPLYEATAHISAPQLKDINQLNYGRSKAKNAPLPFCSVNDVYGIFSKNLLSMATKIGFLNEVFLPSLPPEVRLKNSDEKLAKIFLNSLMIKTTLYDYSPPHYTLTIRGTSPEQVVTWTKSYLNFAKIMASNELLANVEVQRDDIIQDLQDKLDLIRDIADMQLQDRVAQLHEAIKVAQVVGIRSPVNGITADSSTINHPSMMYLRGSTALQAELNSLSKRGSSDAFIPSKFKLRETQRELEFYKKIAVKADNIAMFRLDNVISQPETPISLSKKLILILAIAIGMFSGVLLALIHKALVPKNNIA